MQTLGDGDEPPSQIVRHKAEVPHFECEFASTGLCLRYEFSKMKFRVIVLTTFRHSGQISDWKAELKTLYLITRRLFLLSVISIWLTVSVGMPTAHASDEITLHLNLLPHRLTTKSEKQYDLFLKEIFNESDEIPLFQASPLARAVHIFLGDFKSCLFPANARAIEAGSLGKALGLLSSVPLDVVSLRMYTTKEHKNIVKLDDFPPGRVGYIRGSGAVDILGPIAKNFTALSSEEQLIRMLELGRIDAFLGHHPDTALALDYLDKPQALHVSPLIIKNLSFPISFVCHNSKETKAFLDYINPRIETMHSNGQLRQILGPYAEFDTPGNSGKTSPLTE